VRRRFLRVVGLAALVLVGGQLSATYLWERASVRHVPRGQAELVTLREPPAALIGAFNAAADQTRVVALLSPT
jgi:hypothetical protein